MEAVTPGSKKTMPAQQKVSRFKFSCLNISIIALAVFISLSKASAAGPLDYFKGVRNNYNYRHGKMPSRTQYIESAEIDLIDKALGDLTFESNAEIGMIEILDIEDRILFIRAFADGHNRVLTGEISHFSKQPDFLEAVRASWRNQIHTIRIRHTHPDEGSIYTEFSENDKKSLLIQKAFFDRALGRSIRAESQLIYSPDADHVLKKVMILPSSVSVLKNHYVTSTLLDTGPYPIHGDVSPEAFTSEYTQPELVARSIYQQITKEILNQRSRTRYQTTIHKRQLISKKQLLSFEFEAALRGSSSRKEYLQTLFTYIYILSIPFSIDDAHRVWDLISETRHRFFPEALDNSDILSKVVKYIDFFTLKRSGSRALPFVINKQDVLESIGRTLETISTPEALILLDELMFLPAMQKSEPDASRTTLPSESRQPRTSLCQEAFVVF